MAAPRKPNHRKDWHTALNRIQSEAEKTFPEHVGKLDQLRSVVATANMLVDELHDTTPYQPNSTT